MLRAVSIPAAKSRVDDYAHQLSGGMRQRVMIRMVIWSAVTSSTMRDRRRMNGLGLIRLRYSWCQSTLDQPDAVDRVLDALRWQAADLQMAAALKVVVSASPI